MSITIKKHKPLGIRLFVMVAALLAIEMPPLFGLKAFASSSETCSLLEERALNAFSRYKEIRNLNSSDASFNALQNLANYCPSAKTCSLIKDRVLDAKERHKQIGNINTSNALDLSLEFQAHYCMSNEYSQQPEREQHKQLPQETSSNEKKQISAKEESDRIKLMFDENNYEGIVQEARSGRKFLPSDFNTLGVAHYKTKRFEQAVNYFSAAEKQYPNDPVIKINMGDNYISYGYLEAAVEKYRDALALDPNNSLAQQRLKEAEAEIQHDAQKRQQKYDADFCKVFPTDCK